MFSLRNELELWADLCEIDQSSTFHSFSDSSIKQICEIVLSVPFWNDSDFFLRFFLFHFVWCLGNKRFSFFDFPSCWLSRDSMGSRWMSTEKKNRWAFQHNGFIVLNWREHLNKSSWHSIAYRKRMVWENDFDALVELFDHRVDIIIKKIFYFATKNALFFVKSPKCQIVSKKIKTKKVWK